MYSVYVCDSDGMGTIRDGVCVWLTLLVKMEGLGQFEPISLPPSAALLHLLFLSVWGFIFLLLSVIMPGVSVGRSATHGCFQTSASAYQ